jgi:hypothetical protein
MTIGNPYVNYYLEQQRGRGMPVFHGSAWQAGYGNQTGYGLGGLFRSLSRKALPFLKKGIRAAVPLAKRGAKMLGDVAMQSGSDFLSDVLTGKNIKEAAKARALEAAGTVKGRALSKLRGQTGSGKRRHRSKSVKRAGKRRKTSTSKRSQSRTVRKKRKASASSTRRRQTKRRKTAQDIFG